MRQHLLGHRVTRVPFWKVGQMTFDLILPLHGKTKLGISIIQICEIVYIRNSGEKKIFFFYFFLSPTNDISYRRWRQLVCKTQVSLTYSSQNGLALIILSFWTNVICHKKQLFRHSLELKQNWMYFIFPSNIPLRGSTFLITT